MMLLAIPVSVSATEANDIVNKHALAPEGNAYLVGAALVDITPEEPIRLSGYGGRRAESDGIEDRLYAKALAVSMAGESTAPAVLIAIDTCILSLEIRDEIAERIENAHGVPRDRITLAVSHSHTTPMLRGTIPNLFGEPIPADHEQRIAEYTDRFITLIVDVAARALNDREPCRLAWGQGKAGFAANRRTRGGPVDHSVPVLCARRADGRIKVVVANYACHCTTLGGDYNRVSPDWAGYASAALEAHHSGAIALVTIGCGGDQNPAPRTGIDLARKHGLALADEINRVLRSSLSPLSGDLQVVYRLVALDLADPQPADHWKSLADQPGAIGRHARLQLDRLERGEPLVRQVDLPVQTWRCGNDLALVFLGGEVVVDYSLRLKKELDPDRLWISAYSNAVPCYIPSERILKEGGYEGASAMVYYDLPGPFRPGVENTLVEEVKRQLGTAYLAENSRTERRLALAAVAAVILDDSLPNERREAVIAEHAGDSAELLRHLVEGLKPGTPEELHRIPWIWRVTVAAGKRNDPKELVAILDASLPEQEQPLLEWQAVVIGGGIINGLGLVDVWPAERLDTLLEDRPALRSRWKAAIAQSAKMAEDEKVIPGTRYDALRMLALDDWSKAQPILERYLTHDDASLQQGAVSGLADVRNPEAAHLLLSSLGHLKESNRMFALDALVRDHSRMALTLDAVDAGTLSSDLLGEERLQRIRESDDQELRERAARLQ